LALQQTEKRLLVARQLEAFLSNLHTKEQALHTIAQVETQRQAMVNRLAPLLNLHDTSVTLQQLSARLPEPYASTMGQCRQRLQRLLHEVQRSSGENARLVRDALALVEEALAFFASLLPSTPTYEPSGTFSPAMRGRLLSGTV
jgi:FlgN protein